MRKRLLILLAIGFALILVVWVAANPSPQRRPVPTNGPVRLSLTGRITSTSELSAFQLEGLTQRLMINSHMLAAKVTNALMIQISNCGPQTFEMWGYDSASPIYDIYIEGTNGLERLEVLKPERVPVIVNLGPTQSLSFPLMPPATDKPWHVCVSYRDFLAPAPGITRKPPTQLEILIERTRTFIPFLRRSEPAFYWTMSESIGSQPFRPE